MNTPLQIVARDVAFIGTEANVAAHLACAPAGAHAVVTQQGGAVLRLDLRSGHTTYRGRLPAAAGRPARGRPAVVADEAGQYLLANYTGNKNGPELWVSDLVKDRHWQVGPGAHQLMRAADGNVWGVLIDRETARDTEGEMERRWGWPPFGRLFCYTAGAPYVEEFPNAGPVSLVVPAPGPAGRLFLVHSNRVSLYDTVREAELASALLAAPPLAATVDYSHGLAWFTLPRGCLCGCSLLATGEISIIIVGERFGPTDRGFFRLPQSGWLAGVSADGTVSVFDPDTQRVYRVAGLTPRSAGLGVDAQADVWYLADEQATRYSLEVAAGSPGEVFRQGQEEMTVGSLHLTVIHESMRMLLRRTDAPIFQSEVMCPEAVDPRGSSYFPDSPRLAWNRSMQGIHWKRIADGWFELRENFPDFGYISRVRLNPDGLRLDLELTANNYGERELQSVHFSPCAGLSGDLVDLRHQRTYVVTGNGQLGLLGPLVGDYPYVAASVRGALNYQLNPDKPRAFHFVDLQLAEHVIIVRALDGRGSLVTGFENAGSIEALFVPCIHCETYVEKVPAGGSARVRGFVAWIPGDENAAYAYFREWWKSLA